MYKHFNDRIILSTRRNKTEAKYLTNFIDWCEGFDSRSKIPDNLIEIIELLKSHRYIDKFDFRFKNSSTWTGGTIASVYLEISNKAFKIPVVTFIQQYSPGELTRKESEKYMRRLENLSTESISDEKRN